MRAATGKRRRADCKDQWRSPKGRGKHERERPARVLVSSLQSSKLQDYYWIREPGYESSADQNVSGIFRMRCAFEGNTSRAHSPRSHISKTRTYTLKLSHDKTRLPSSYIAIENPKPSTKFKNVTHSLPCIHCLLRRLCCVFDYSVRHGNTNRASFITAVPGLTIDLGINTILEFLASARRVDFSAGQENQVIPS